MLLTVIERQLKNIETELETKVIVERLLSQRPFSTIY